MEPPQARGPFDQVLGDRIGRHRVAIAQMRPDYLGVEEVAGGIRTGHVGGIVKLGAGSGVKDERALLPGKRECGDDFHA